MCFKNKNKKIKYIYENRLINSFMLTLFLLFKSAKFLQTKFSLLYFSLFKIKMVPLRQITWILLKSTNNGKKKYI